eukprot:11174961-Lingulodinium_polyedra.AAC.1
MFTLPQRPSELDARASVVPPEPSFYPVAWACPAQIERNRRLGIARSRQAGRRFSGTREVGRKQQRLSPACCPANHPPKGPPFEEDATGLMTMCKLALLPAPSSRPQGLPPPPHFQGCPWRLPRRPPPQQRWGNASRRLPVFGSAPRVSAEITPNSLGGLSSNGAGACTP